MNDPDPTFRKLVVQALGVSGSPDAVPHRESFLDDMKSEDCGAVQRALATLGPLEVKDREGRFSLLFQEFPIRELEGRYLWVTNDTFR